MNQFISANTLAAHIRRTTLDAYEPMLTSIHTVLQRHGLKPIKKYYGNKVIEVYNTNNAKRCATQYIWEIKQEDKKTINAKEWLKYHMQNPQGKPYIEHPQYVPPKHGESRISKELLKMDESLGVSDEIKDISDMIFEYILAHHREYGWKVCKETTGDAEGKNDIYTKVFSLDYDFLGKDIYIIIQLFQYNPQDDFKEKYDYIAYGASSFKNCYKPSTKTIIFSFLWPITDRFTPQMESDIKGTINHEVKHMFQYIKKNTSTIDKQYLLASDNFDACYQSSDTDKDPAKWLILYYIPRVYYRFDKEEVAAWLQELYIEANGVDHIKDTKTAKKIQETIEYYQFLLKIYNSKKQSYDGRYRDFLISKIKELTGCNPEQYFKVCKKGLDHFLKQSRKVYQRWSNETGKSVTGNDGSFKKYKEKEIEPREIFTGKKKGLLKFKFIENIMNTLKKIYLN